MGEYTYKHLFLESPNLSIKFYASLITWLGPKSTICVLLYKSTTKFGNRSQITSTKLNIVHESHGASSFFLWFEIPRSWFSVDRLTPFSLESWEISISQMLLDNTLNLYNFRSIYGNGNVYKLIGRVVISKFRFSYVYCSHSTRTNLDLLHFAPSLLYFALLNLLHFASKIITFW